MCPICKVTGYHPVCGSDGRSYADQCLLEKSSCLLQKNIKVISKGPCGKSSAVFYCVDFSLYYII